MIVAFSGHRPQKLGGFGPSAVQDHVRWALRCFLEQYRPESAIVGMALGVDQWAAETCIELGVPFTAAVPFDGHGSNWPEASQRHYRELLFRAQRVVVVCPGLPYEARQLQTRNEWMVDRANLLFAVWDGSRGGTANCVKYALRVGRAVLQFNPRD